MHGATHLRQFPFIQTVSASLVQTVSAMASRTETSSWPSPTDPSGVRFSLRPSAVAPTRCRCALAWADISQQETPIVDAASDTRTLRVNFSDKGQRLLEELGARVGLVRWMNSDEEIAKGVWSAVDPEQQNIVESEVSRNPVVVSEVKLEPRSSVGLAPTEGASLFVLQDGEGEIIRELPNGAPTLDVSNNATAEVTYDSTNSSPEAR